MISWEEEERKKEQAIADEIEKLENLRLQNQKIERIFLLFKEREGVSIEKIAKTLEISRNDLIEFLIENSKILGEIRISSGKIFISSHEDISDFIKILDGQFRNWEGGKKSDKIMYENSCEN